MEFFNPTAAFLGTMYVGTDKLGRPLTKTESKELSSLLRKHDFVGASMVALRFAFKLRKDKAAARDLQGRAQLRLVRHGWDPSEVSLVKRMCRLVWSEHTHEASEDATRRKAEEGFLREQGLDHSAAPSVEDEITRLATENEEIARDARRLASLRAAFVAADDEVNLLYLKYRIRGYRGAERDGAAERARRPRVLSRGRQAQAARRANSRRGARRNL